MTRPATKRLSDAEIRSRLAERLPGWEYGDDGLHRRYRTEGWPITLLLVSHIGYIAEAADHHPDLEVSWGEVLVKLRTHDADGVTAKDLELAERIEEAVLWRPAADSALSGTRGRFVQPG